MYLSFNYAAISLDKCSNDVGYQFVCEVNSILDTMNEPCT